MTESLGPMPRSTPEMVTLVPPSTGPDSGDTYSSKFRAIIQKMNCQCTVQHTASVSRIFNTALKVSYHQSSKCVEMLTRISHHKKCKSFTWFIQLLTLLFSYAQFAYLNVNQVRSDSWKPRFWRSMHLHCVWLDLSKCHPWTSMTFPDTRSARSTVSGLRTNRSHTPDQCDDSRRTSTPWRNTWTCELKDNKTFVIRLTCS